MIFDNSLYKNQILIVFKYLRYKMKISRLKISKALGIPYNTYCRMEDNSFSKHLDVLLKIEDLFNIKRYDKFDYLNNKSDEALLNFMYNKEFINIPLSINDITFIQYNINKLIISGLRDEEAINELFVIKDYLNANHKIIYDAARNIVNDEEILIKGEDKYIIAYLSYIKLKMMYKKERFIAFILSKYKIFRILEEYLMIDRLLELKMYDIIVLYKLNSNPIDNINYLMRNNRYIEELIIIKSLYYLKNNKIGQALTSLNDSQVLDKYLIIGYIKGIDYNTLKMDRLKKSKIYSFVEKEIKNTLK